MLDWLTTTELLDNPLDLWLLAVATSLLGFFVVKAALKLATRVLTSRQAQLPKTARAIFLKLLDATRRWIVLLLALMLGGAVLEYPDRVELFLGHAVFILVGPQLALWANSLIDLWLETTASPGRSRINPVIASILGWAAQILVWTVLLMFVLANMGVNITALVASLGVGGIAVALAVQNILGDLFASAAIGLDKPFEVGQFIAFGNDLGTVEHVGIRTTRIKSLSGEQLVISNTNLLNQLIRNYGRMAERRVVFGFRVPYVARRERVQEIPARVRKVIEAEEQARFDRGHLLRFSEFGYEFEFVYYVLNPDYTLYCDIQQRVNFAIMAMLEEFGTGFAVPVRELRLSDEFEQGLLAGRAPGELGFARDDRGHESQLRDTSSDARVKRISKG